MDKNSPNYWNQRREKTHIIQWLLLAACFAILAYLFTTM